MAELEDPEQKEQEEPRGLRCPKCNCSHFWKVNNTQPAHGNKIYRYRYCRNCGHRMRTKEMPG